MIPERARLPDRRPSHLEMLEVDGQVITACIGFDPKIGRPREVFLNGGREGSLLAAILADAAVAISVAVQHGVPGAALAKSVGRLPTGPVALSDLDQPQTEKLPASPIGAALDLVVFFEREDFGYGVKFGHLYFLPRRLYRQLPYQTHLGRA